MLAKKLTAMFFGVFIFLSLVAPAAQAAPPPNCFDDYASLYKVTYNSQFGITSGRVNIYAGSQATYYVQVNGGPVNEYRTSRTGFADKTFSGMGPSVTVYVSIYKGNYWVCSGTGYWSSVWA